MIVIRTTDKPAQDNNDAASDAKARLEYEVARLRLEQGDVLVLLTPRRLEAAVAQKFKDALQRIAPGHKVLVLADGMRLLTISAAEAEALK